MPVEQGGNVPFLVGTVFQQQYAAFAQQRSAILATSQLAWDDLFSWMSIGK